jgi:hypothetical protein
VGFWPVHTASLWGNQVWFDLLLAVSIGWFLLVPPARALGMPLGRWLLLVASSGCIGLLAMLARVLYLQEAARRPHAAASQAAMVVSRSGGSGSR